MVRLQWCIMRATRLQVWSARNNWRLMRKTRTMKKVKLLDDTLEIQTLLWPSGKPKDRQNHSVVGKGCTRTPCRAGMGLCAILELQLVAPCSRLLLWCILADGKKPCRFMIPVSLFAQKLPINHWLHLPFSGDTATNSLCHLVVFRRLGGGSQPSLVIIVPHMMKQLRCMPHRCGIFFHIQTIPTFHLKKWLKGPRSYSGKLSAVN